jgi:Mor family transcriptional regulator
MDTLQEIYQIVLASLQQQGIEQAEAVIIATNVIEAMQNQLAGNQVYIPCKKVDVIEKRNALLIASFNGHNHDELSRLFRITKSYVYEIVKKAYSRKQTTIFD